MDLADPMFVIVMGVSGSGKTSIAQRLSAATGWPYVEGDDFHPAANIAKMHAGIPLTDDDRWPWLDAVGAWISAHEVRGDNAVITCSALKRSYRDRLRDGRSGIRFLMLDVPVEELRRRVANRPGHFMPASLLDSQLATLEPLEPDEDGVVVDATGHPDEVLAAALTALGLTDVAQAGSA
ncbi:gluconokinase [Branchiibius sp. NY16-3462-2]|uniref:gluconokinase n=1 Tax=Branchiibius sp. NY16-3462-2 TaxID=1807500 RepID=UPI000A74B80B|nr:gluconokinase [Branchiibius sp. NY16-3462-2]